MKKFLLYTLLLYTVTTNAQCWESLSNGETHIIAIKPSGTLWGWGRGLFLGNGDVTTATPEQIGTATDWKSVHAGYQHSFGIKDNGTLWGWGANDRGNLATGGITPLVTAPIQLGTQTWKTVDSGAGHSIGIRSNGTLWGWGWNDFGQVGDGITVTKYVQVQIDNNTNWKMVSVASTKNMAIKEDGTLWGWGLNAPFLGITSETGGQNFILVPTQIGTDTDWKTLAVHSGHHLALKNDNSLWAWGSSDQGQLGLGNTTSSFLPAQVGTATDWVFIEADGQRSFAIKADGTLWAWGRGTWGVLGSGNETDLLVPTQITTATDWKEVSTSAFATAALQTDGSLYTWGLPSFGQIGDGTQGSDIVFTPLFIDACNLSSDDFIKTSSLLLYPNPAHDKVNIRFETLQGESQVEIYDMTGRMISSFTNTGQQGVYELDLASMATGVYVVLLRQGTKVLMQRKLQVYKYNS